jgi:hypothetical protein
MKFAVMALLVIHGLIHAMGFAGAWGLAEFEGASKTPTNFVTTSPGTSMVRGLGLLWLAALLAFLVAAALLLADSTTWRPVAVAAVLISMVPVALWRKNAPMGALANAVVITAVVLADRFELA